MKLIFAGTPAFAASALSALIDAGHDIVLVLTQPDRPAGRGMKLRPSPVKALALEHGLRVEQPLTLKTEEARAMLASVGAEVMVVAAYGLILPPSVLELPPRGCLNIHASLLPRWRGAAPIQRAILAGDAETGITIMQMDAGLDTGAMLSVHPVAIAADETALTLHDRLARSGAEAIVATLATLPERAAAAQAQPADGVSYAAKLTREESRIDWTAPALDIERAVRAYNPVPGAHTLLEGALLKVWCARAVPGKAAPGVLLSDADGRWRVGTGEGLLELDEIQAAGAKRMAVEDFMRSRADLAGTLLGV